MPESEVPAPKGTGTHHDRQIAIQQSTEFDGLAAQRKRRAAAVRLPGGDPTQPGRKYHRPTVGLRAVGMKEGHARGVTYACRELWAYLSPEGQLAAKALVAAAKGGSV